MKINTLKSRWFLSVLSCATLSMSSQSNGAVIVKFEQVGLDVVATWSGSIDLGMLNGAFMSFNTGAAGATQLFSMNDDSWVYINGTVALDTGLNGVVDSFTGNGGFDGGSFIIDGDTSLFMPASSVYNFDSLNVSQTFANDTLENIGASSFNNTLAWTSSAGETNTVSYTTVVPEPSSSVLVGLGALTLTIRRRR